MVVAISKIFKKDQADDYDLNGDGFLEQDDEELVAQFDEDQFPYPDEDEDEEDSCQINLSHFSKMRFYYDELQVYDEKEKNWHYLYHFPPSVRQQLIDLLSPDDNLSDTGYSDYTESVDGFEQFAKDDKSDKQVRLSIDFEKHILPPKDEEEAMQEQLTRKGKNNDAS